IYTRAYRLLDEATRAIPRVMEIFYHHKIKLSDDFMMKPGYLNFQEVEAGEVLARDVNGEIRSPANARILMPLYQAQGEDGFLLVRERRTDEARMTG
ncbi:hypothetical protein KDL45_09695, partial [bacterium]|nr:hypothetical protein [bacterium]